jgi:tRNA(Ile)-lysidine synthase
MARQMELLDKLKTSLISEDLIDKGDKILLAVSGGLDSRALLDLFAKLGDSYNLQLAVLHVHHGIRGDEADDDLEFVRALAQRYNLPFYFKKVEAEKFARKHRYSLEESARILRYQVYEEFLRQTKFNKLATGHTADDQAETIMDHFLRGSGIIGMRGMLKVRGPYIRPLLIFRRKDLESYVQHSNLEFREDSSNKELRYKRNRIRRELIPYLEKHFNPNLIDALNRLGKIHEENEKFLEVYAAKAYNSLVLIHKKDKIILDIEGFLNYFTIVRKYILFQASKELSIFGDSLNFEKVCRIQSVVSQREIGKKVPINQEWQLLVDHDGIVIKKKKQARSKIKVNVLEGSSLQFQQYELRWSILNDADSIVFNRNSKVEFVDFNRTGSKLFLRTLLPGDRFIPLNFTGHKKVADYFSDRKVPHHLREEIPILESSHGIVWICGYSIDDRFKVTEQTNQFLKLEMNEVSSAA